MVGPVAKREGVARLRAVMGLSERRACLIVGADRKMIRYRSCRPAEADLRARLHELANERRRFGYRRLFAKRVSVPPLDGLILYLQGSASVNAGRGYSGG